MDLEVACCDNPGFKNDLCKQLGQCWNLQTLDMSGCSHIDDQGIVALSKGEVQLRAGLPSTNPGLIKMISCKLGNIKLTDYGLTNLVKACPNLQHLELQRTQLDESGFKLFVKELPQLSFLDLTSVPGVTVAILEEIKQKKPGLTLRQYRTDKYDPKDNGLRVPRRIIEKEKKKKKGKKK